VKRLAIWDHLLWGLEERSFLKRSAEVLANDFPNPNRDGCPSASVLEKIAAKKMPIQEASSYLAHLSSCSACFEDFRRFKTAARRPVRRNLIYAAAAVAVTVAIGAWFLTQTLRNQPREAVIDLRDQSASRGIVPPQNAAPALPEVSRFARRVTLLLPIGAEGHYAVELKTNSGVTVANSEGSVLIHDSAARLSLGFALRELPPGIYELKLKPDSGQPVVYHIKIK
jgi:hypothetical protein